MRYVLTVILVVGAFGTALHLRKERAAPTDVSTPTVMPIEIFGRPDVRKQKVEGGTEVQVHFCFAGTCSRAKVVYEHEGREKVLDATTNCQRSLVSTSASNSDVRGDGYLSEVELGGKLPDGASNVRLILESETGVRVAPVEL